MSREKCFSHIIVSEISSLHYINIGKSHKSQILFKVFGDTSNFLSYIRNANNKLLYCEMIEMRILKCRKCKVYMSCKLFIFLDYAWITFCQEIDSSLESIQGELNCTRKIIEYIFMKLDSNIIKMGMLKEKMFLKDWFSLFLSFFQKCIKKTNSVPLIQYIF